jgi:hypothetical protein
VKIILFLKQNTKKNIQGPFSPTVSCFINSAKTCLSLHKLFKN